MIAVAYYLVTAVLLVALAASLARAIIGPTLPDACGTVVVLLIVALGYLMGRPDFTDIALIYALINFVGTIALLKFFQFGDLGYTEDTGGRR